MAAFTGHCETLRPRGLGFRLQGGRTSKVDLGILTKGDPGKAEVQTPEPPAFKPREKVGGGGGGGEDVAIDGPCTWACAEEAGEVRLKTCMYVAYGCFFPKIGGGGFAFETSKQHRISLDLPKGHARKPPDLGPKP